MATVSPEASPAAVAAAESALVVLVVLVLVVVVAGAGVVGMEAEQGEVVKLPPLEALFPPPPPPFQTPHAGTGTRTGQVYVTSTP